MNFRDATRRYAKMNRPNVFFLCMHKAASTFVAGQLLKGLAKRDRSLELFQIGSKLIQFNKWRKESQGIDPPSTVEEREKQMREFFEWAPIPRNNALVGRMYPGHLHAIRQHLELPLPSSKNRLFVMRRDPRDALISMYYSISFSHDPKKVEQNVVGFENRRSQYQKSSVHQILREMLCQGKEQGTIQEFHALTDLILDHDDVIDLPYELLISDPYLWLIKFVEGAELENYVDDQWFDEMAECLKPPTEIDPKSHKRRVVPGYWSEYYNEELELLTKNIVGDRLNQFGYTW